MVTLCCCTAFAGQANKEALLSAMNKVCRPRTTTQVWLAVEVREAAMIAAFMSQVRPSTACIVVPVGAVCLGLACAAA